MNKFYTIISILFLSYQMCIAQTNGNAELNNFNYWKRYVGHRYHDKVNITNDCVWHPNKCLRTLPSNAPSPGTAPYQKHTIVNDNPPVGYLDLPLTILEGNYTFRLGDNVTSGAGGKPEVDAMSYTFTVTNSNKNLSFKYALKMQDGQHDRSTQAGFTVHINEGLTPSTRPSKVIHDTMYAADATNPNYIQQTSGNVTYDYLPWQTVCQDLSAYVNKKVTITFASYDCAPNAHWAYAYVDGLFDQNLPTAILNFTKNQYCKNDQIIADIRGSLGDQWSLSVTPLIAGKPEASTGWQNPPFGLVPLNTMLDTLYGNNPFDCNKEYLITLKVKNCVGITTVQKTITIICPQTNAGPDKEICCPNPSGSTVTIGTPACSGCTYNWTSPDVSFSSTAAQPTFHPTQSANYMVTATDANGCSSKDNVDVFLLSRFNVNITTIDKGCCEHYLKANVTFVENCDPNTSQAWYDKKVKHLNFSWNNGAYTGQTIPFAPGVTSYTVTVKPTGNCPAPVTVSTGYNPYLGLTGDFPVLSIRNHLHRGASGTAGYASIRPLYVPVDTANAFNAHKFELIIFDRWGTVVRTIRGERCSGINQEAIRWNGKDDAGHYVPAPYGMESYNYKLTLYNCTYPYGQFCLTYGSKKCPKWKRHWFSWNPNDITCLVTCKHCEVEDYNQWPLEIYTECIGTFYINEVDY